MVKLTLAQTRALRMLENPKAPWRTAFVIGESVSTLKALEKMGLVIRRDKPGCFGWEGENHSIQWSRKP